MSRPLLRNGPLRVILRYMAKKAFRCLACTKTIPAGDNFCSDDCYYAMNPSMKPRPPGPKPRPFRVNCFRCGTEFASRGAKFCSDACRQTNYRELHGATPKLPAVLRLRFQVFERDGFRCRYCGRHVDEGIVLNVDHVLPVSKGGEWNLENLVTACRECNAGKFDHLLERRL